MPVFAAKGTRDFLPDPMRNRLSVIQTIRDVYALFGFGPLDTPAFERIDTLMGKYGDEGNQLIFKIQERGSGAATGQVDMALRYDLTVPLARVVAMNPALPMPFKRYQIAPVWRADRPQKGRFCEFYQCDADIVGDVSPTADAECIMAACTVLEKLGLSDFVVHINHREILRAIVSTVGAQDRETEILVSIDKMDKIGLAGVTQELLSRGINSETVTQLVSILSEPHDLDRIEALVGTCQNLRVILSRLRGLGLTKIVFDATIARGLSYYTGVIYEIRLADGDIGSIAAGGRYDNLVGMFSGKQVPAVGISLGLERILVIMEERGLFQSGKTEPSVLVTVFSDDTLQMSLKLATMLREQGVPTSLWLGASGGLGKQFKYANQIGATFVLVCGPDEIAQDTVSVKTMCTGEQSTMPVSDVACFVVQKPSSES